MFKNIKYVLEYIPFYICAGLFSLLPLSACTATGRALGRFAFLIDRRHRKVAVNNISAAMRLDSEGAESLARQVFEQVGITFAEFLKIPSLTRRYFEEHVSVYGIENYLDARKERKGVFLLGAHIGNWEFVPSTHLMRGGEASVVFKKVKNPYVNNYIDRIRTSCGLKTIPSRNSVREIMHALNKGTDVGILLDQHAGSKEAVNTSFFGLPASTNYGLALLSIRTGVPVVPVFVIRKGEGRFNCFYEEPLYAVNSGNLKNDILCTTMMYNAVIEKYVRKYPEQWFWIHDRWRIARTGEKGRALINHDEQ